MSKLFTWCIYAIPGARESRPGTKLVGCAHRCPQLWHTRVPAHDKRQMRLRRRGTDGLSTHRWRGVDSNFRFRDALSGADVNRSRAADDFATIRARMKELRRERERAQAPEADLPCDPPTPRARTDRWPPREISEEPGRVRQSGAVRS